MVINKKFLLCLLFLCLSCYAQRYNHKEYKFNYKIDINQIRLKGYYFNTYELNKDYHVERGHFIRMRIFLNNGYTYYVQNGFGKQCGDSISIDCATKMSEYMLEKNINDFLKDTDNQGRSNHHLWNWGKYNITNDSITIQWYYNYHGRYFLAEERGIIIDSISFKIFYFKDYRTSRDTLLDELYRFKEYPIEKMYNKIPKKLLNLDK